MSTESIASPSSATGAAPSCARCGAPLADDQRYCLQCGERVAPMSSVLLAGPPQAAATAPATEATGALGPGPAPAGSAGPGATPPGFAPPGASPAGGGGRNNAVTVIAGVGVLLLAMGIGVLIGRAGGSKPSTAAPQVISVSSAPAATGASTSGAEEAASFTDDWPAGAKGYAVQLQTLPIAGTQTSAVEAAKSSAEGKGAKQVGALKSEDFSGLPSGNYVVYSGKYDKQAEAQKALAGLKKSFPSASVIHITGGAGGSTTAKGSTPSTPSSGKSGAGSSESNPAPPKVLEDLHKSKGKSYEEKSKNLPDVVGT